VFPGAGAYGGFQMPDVVANLRADQAWGSAQVMGAVHQVNATYYGASASSGHPSDAYGFAVGAGIKVLAPMVAPGDYLQAQVNYAVGASRYVFFTPNSNWGKAPSSTSNGWGVLSDAVYSGGIGGAAGGVGAAGNPTDLQLTTSWGVNAAYEHFWNMKWRTSAYGGYAAVNYNSTANSQLCFDTSNGAAAAAAINCNMNWSTWWAGTRTQWNVTPDTYLAVDLLYQKLNSATWDNLGPGGSSRALTNLGAANTWAVVDKADPDNWSIRFRVHRDFYP
jgi:hypothetical protein